MFDSITLQAVTSALDATLLRQQAIATNVANAGTPGYTPVRVEFESRLSEAQEALGQGESLDASMLRAPVVVSSFTPNGEQGVRLDQQMSDMVTNSVRYQALVKGLGDEYKLLSAALNEGK
jgi:flagellar basal-body rod protein FlgB